MTSNASAAGGEQGSVSEIPVTPIGATQSAIDVAEAAQEHQERENAEEALESHEVIELQAFIERKEWIEEKIKVRL